MRVASGFLAFLVLLAPFAAAAPTSHVAFHQFGPCGPLGISSGVCTAELTGSADVTGCTSDACTVSFSAGAVLHGPPDVMTVELTTTSDDAAPVTQCSATSALGPGTAMGASCFASRQLVTVPLVNGICGSIAISTDARDVAAGVVSGSTGVIYDVCSNGNGTGVIGVIF